MKKLDFSFLALSHSIDMTFESTVSIDQLSNDFVLLFVKEEDIDRENHKINIKSLQQNTAKLRQRVDAFIDHYKDANIKVFQLHSYFQKLTEGEYFLIWPGNPLTTEQRMDFYNYLASLQEGKDYNTIKKQMDELFGKLRKVYSLNASDESTKKPIGEQDKSKRVCRFCNNTRVNVSFKNIAHAISESLGNKKIILNEECDGCNSDFGSASGIESSLITFLKFYGIFFGVKGKSGIPKIKGSNFELSNDGQIEIKHYADSDEELEKEVDLTEAKFRLDTYDNIVMQDIYRTLCKYSLSVIDASVVPQFKDTIDWLNRKTTIPKLPKVAILASYNFFKTHPSLIVYLRKDNSTEFPYAVGEFHYTFLTFVFIIPLTKADSKDFTDEKDYGKFWDFFKHYSMTKDWDFRDFSDNTKRKFTLNLNLKKSGDKSTTA
jgi:hypothetical protein